MKIVVVEVGSVNLDSILEAINSVVHPAAADVSQANISHDIVSSVTDVSKTSLSSSTRRKRRTKVQMAKDNLKVVRGEAISEDEIKKALEIRDICGRVNFELLSRELCISQLRGMKIVAELTKRGV